MTRARRWRHGPLRVPAAILLSAALAGGGCARRPVAAVAGPLGAWSSADSVRTDSLAPGLVHHYLWIARGPWAVHVLEADRTACWSTVAVKAGAQAVGRAPTSTLLRTLADTLPDPVGGAVNADFFTFDPPGVPIGAHVNDGRVVSGPVDRPVLAFDRDGRAWMGPLATIGFVRAGGDSIPLGGWNQRRRPGVRLFDRRWGAATDSASHLLELAVDSTGRIAVVDTLPDGIAIPPKGAVLTVDRSDSSLGAQKLRRLGRGETVTWRVSLGPLAPAVAVGGFPVLLADSAIVSGLDSAGGANFGPARHPRTAVGVRDHGRRLLLVAVDGRQAPYSDGMTLAELAAFFRAIGATNAINLDGGGSTTMALRKADGAITIANRPSDRTGERAVANALALVRRCRAHPSNGERP